MKLTREMIIKNNLIDGITGKKIDFRNSTVTIPAFVINEDGNKFLINSIGRDAFKYCKSLEGIIIPYTVKCIEDFAFAECANLKTIVMMNGIEKIGDYSFTGCKSLIKINIPNSVIIVGCKHFIYSDQSSKN